MVNGENKTPLAVFVCLTEKESEKVRDELFAVTSFAEETGFIKGFQYAVMLMAECYTAK